MNWIRMVANTSVLRNCRALLVKLLPGVTLLSSQCLRNCTAAKSLICCSFFILLTLTVLRPQSTRILSIAGCSSGPAAVSSSWIVCVKACRFSWSLLVKLPWIQSRILAGVPSLGLLELRRAGWGGFRRYWSRGALDVSTLPGLTNASMGVGTGWCWWCWGWIAWSTLRHLLFEKGIFFLQLFHLLKYLLVGVFWSFGFHKFDNFIAKLLDGIQLRIPILLYSIVFDTHDLVEVQMRMFVNLSGNICPQNSIYLGSESFKWHIASVGDQSQRPIWWTSTANLISSNVFHWTVSKLLLPRPLCCLYHLGKTQSIFLGGVIVTLWCFPFATYFKRSRSKFMHSLWRSKPAWRSIFLISGSRTISMMTRTTWLTIWPVSRVVSRMSSRMARARLTRRIHEGIRNQWRRTKDWSDDQLTLQKLEHRYYRQRTCMLWTKAC